MKLSILMPVYNEIATIEEILERVQRLDIGALEKELVIVDDGSTDGTREYLGALPEQPGRAIHMQPYNQGKGAAIAEAWRHATGDIYIIQDADLEYDPEDIPAVIKPIIDGRADVVYGSRFLGQTHRSQYFLNYVANKILTLLSNILTNQTLTDMEVCHKAFKREIADRIQIESKRFGIEPELTAKVAKLRCRIYEVPISYSGREFHEGKKIGWKDGIEAIWVILKYNLFR